MMHDRSWKCRNKVVALAGLVLFVVLAVVGCGRKDAGNQAAPQEPSPVVARVGENAITVADFERYVADRVLSHHAEVTPQDVEKRLDEMILEELLYQEAQRVKLAQQPEMRRRIRQMLTQKLLDDQMQETIRQQGITEDVLRAYYDQQQQEFNRPAQRRLADIWIAVPSDASEADRAERRQRAQTVLAEALALRQQRTGFATLVRNDSDTPAHYQRGDTGFFDQTGQPVGIDPALAQAAFQLQRVGSLAEQVIATADGFHIVMLIGKRAAVQTPLSAVRQQLKQRLQRQAIQKAREAFLQRLKANATIEIDTEAMAELASALRHKAGRRQPVATTRAGPSALPRQ